MSMATFSDVRARIGGLKGGITQLGDAPDHEHKWKSFPKCPFCSGKNCAGVFAKGDAEFFKCHHRDCTTGGTVMTEVGYIAARGVRQMAAPSADKLIALRTHKKWAKGAKTHCFITRPGGGSVRLAGRSWRPGVAAMPGISFGRKRGGTWRVRHEMDEWLRLNGMTGVVVAYDNEQKGDPSLPGYNDEVEERFDPVTWGLVLARDLGRSRRAWFSMLPESLRDKSGKVDWDGALMKLRESGGERSPSLVPVGSF